MTGHAPEIRDRRTVSRAQDSDRGPGVPATAVHAAAARVVQLLNEVEAGRRPVRQVLPLFAVHLRGALRRAQPVRGPVADLHHLRVTATAERTYEVVAVCRRDRRYGAIGLRLARVDGRWLVTDVARPGLRTRGQ